MFDKFNFYDLLGYLLPGAVVLLLLYWFGRAVLGIPLPDLPTDLGGSFLFIALSYIIGQVLVQGIGSRYEERLNRKDNGRLSDRLLQDNVTFRAEVRPFTPDFKARIAECVKQTFGVVACLDDCFEKGKGVSRRELFELCYARIVQKGLADHTEIFNAIYGLSRGLFVAAWTGILVSGFTFILQVGLLVYKQSGGGLPPKGIFALNLTAVIVAAIGLVVFAVGAWLTNYRFNRFRNYFATSVYYYFVASCEPSGAAVPPSGRQMTQPAPAPPPPPPTPPAPPEPVTVAGPDKAEHDGAPAA